MNRFMDLSNFSFFNFGETLTYYSVDQSPTFTDMKTKQGYMFTTVLRQSNYSIEEQWLLSSFEEAIAMIGGYSSMIWGALMFCIGGYQTFKMESSFAKTLYTRQDEHPKRVKTEEQKLDEGYLVEAINGRVKYDYSYLENWKSWFVTTFFCCCQRSSCYKKRLA